MASELGEVFAEWKEEKREKKQSNLKWSTAELERQGIKFDSKNGGVHLIVYSKSTIDFWPSTGKWIVRGGIYGRGIRKLLNFINKENGNG